MPLLPSHTLLQSYSVTLAITSYLLLTTPQTILNATPLWLLGEAMHIRPATFVPSEHLTNPTTHSPGATLSRKIPILSSSDPSLLLAPSTREVLALLSLILFIASVTQSVLSSTLRYSTSDLTRLAQKSVPTTASLNSTATKSRLLPTPNTAEAEDSRSAFAEKLYYLHTSQTTFLTLAGIRVLGEGALVAYIYLAHSIRGTSDGFLGSSFLSQENPLQDVSAVGLLANRVVFSVVMGDMLFWGYLWTVIREEAREVAGLVGLRRKLVEEAEEEKHAMAN